MLKWTWYVLFVVYPPATCTETRNDNYIQNDAWTGSQRPSMWVVREANNQQLMVSQDDGFLEFGPKDNPRENIFASQYINLSNGSHRKTNGGSVKFSFQSSGNEADKIEGILDISYTDGKYLYATVKPSAERGEEIESTCAFIPAYGKVRAMAVHFLLTEKTSSLIRISDVRLVRADLDDTGNCDIYTETFPFNRLVLANYLSPSIATSPEKGTTANHDIVIATQLTMDRLEQLERMARFWSGPISAAVLILDDDVTHAVKVLTKWFYENKNLSHYVSIHLVFADKLNGNDAILYPVNYLRNIALRHADDRCRYKFLLDVDITPGFDETQAQNWVNEIKSKTNCDKCAYIAPLYGAEDQHYDMPKDKKTLLDLLTQSDPQFKPLRVSSHSVVAYRKWMSYNEPYEVRYREDMEPYFIIDKDAPLMNEMYIGYGRDKCAYSRDVHNDQYKFIVMSDAFLIDCSKDISNTILGRSQGVQVRVFLNIFFHKRDLEAGHLNKISKSVGICLDSDNEMDKFQENEVFSTTDHTRCSENHCDTPGDKDHEMNKYKEPLEVTETNTQLPQVIQKDSNQVQHEHHVQDPISKDTKTKAPTTDTADKDKCNRWFKDINTLDDVPFLGILRESYQYRQDQIAEHLLRAYGVGPFIMLPKPERSSLSLYLPLAHPDHIVTLNPGKGTSVRHHTNRLFSHFSDAKLSVLLARARQEHPGPALFWLLLENQSEAQRKAFTNTLLKTALPEDIIVVLGDLSVLMDLLKKQCMPYQNWEITRTNLGFVMKDPHLPIHPMPKMPTLPNFKDSMCQPQDIKTDLILMTKNRPVQTLAFLQSMNAMITGLNKVWVLYKAEDDIFQRGYEKVLECMPENLNIQLVNDGETGFGKSLLKIMTDMESDYVIFAVDEMVWLRPIKLDVATCLLHTGRSSGSVSSFQFRLGKNILTSDTGWDGRFKELAISGHPDIYAYYPLRLPYDFGYVTHVDGILMHRHDILQDIGEDLPSIKHPGQLENRWIRQGLHTRCRSWHLLYDKSKLVNNALETDGRVIGKDSPVQGSFHLAKLLLEQNKQIDIEAFIQQEQKHTATHISKSVEFTNLKCRIK